MNCVLGGDIMSASEGGTTESLVPEVGELLKSHEHDKKRNVSKLHKDGRKAMKSVGKSWARGLCEIRINTQIEAGFFA